MTATLIKIPRSTECENCGDIKPRGYYMFQVEKDVYCPRCARRRKLALPETIGERIRSLRKANRYSRPYLATLCETTTTMVAGYEWGKSLPGAVKLGQLATQLNTTSDYIIGISEDPNWRGDE